LVLRIFLIYIKNKRKIEEFKRYKAGENYGILTELSEGSIVKNCIPEYIEDIAG